jgi:hypothetical protein
MDHPGLTRISAFMPVAGQLKGCTLVRTHCSRTANRPHINTSTRLRVYSLYERRTCCHCPKASGPVDVIVPHRLQIMLCGQLLEVRVWDRWSVLACGTTDSRGIWVVRRRYIHPSCMQLSRNLYKSQYAGGCCQSESGVGTNGSTCSHCQQPTPSCTRFGLWMVVAGTAILHGISPHLVKALICGLLA